MDLPDEFTATVVRMFGDEGRAWLPTLPERLARCRERWDLRDSRRAPFLSINYIEFATDAAGRPVALKVGVPHADTHTEIAALRHYAGRGAVPFIAADGAAGALLMARLRPGTMLWEWGNDIEQTRAAARCMRQLPDDVPAVHAFPHVTEQLQRMDRATRRDLDPEARWMPRDLLDAARLALGDLAASHPDVLLHGDLHQENILLDEERGWQAIDPKGVIGPAPMETGRYLRNRLPEDAPEGRSRAALEERLSVFAAELGWERPAVAAAGLVDGVLSTCWTLEEEAAERPDWQARLASIRWLAGNL